ncbi:uncharacterized protein LOC135704095 [Ochlerotatus camptorhynchus]|uniref:uncharacterized protein LOC135704095 n=1 Tax=Ochlerotatus camptorhynchus TaxID=644619 RepID=UPI0031D853B1
MESLKEQLNPEEYEKLEDHKFTNDSLKYLTESDLKDIGIVEKGPLLLILSIVHKLKQAQADPVEVIETCSPQAGPSRGAPGFESEPTTIRQSLDRNAKFRSILYSKLDAGIVPIHKELLFMVRILCDSMVSKLLNEKIYPATKEKKSLAKKNIETFPVLTSTKLTESSPEYSYFFWRNAGKGPNHEHSGLIHSHLRNAASKHLRSTDRKFTHKKKAEKVTTVSTVIIELAEECANKDGVSANFKAIMRGMEETHSLYVMMLQNRRSFSSILQTFPHFRSFHGVLIQKTYERITPNYDKNSILAKIFSRGLMVEQGIFSGIQDDNLRGCLRIMQALSRRGFKQQEREHDKDLTIEHKIASDLVCFVLDTESSLAEQLARYVACNVEQGASVAPHIIFQGDEYFIYILGELIHCGDSSAQVLDVFFKCFSVFNVSVSPQLQKIKDFVDIVSFKTMKHSTRQSVNRLTAMFLESFKADNAN